jgi:hypothetical protein
MALANLPPTGTKPLRSATKRRALLLNDADKEQVLRTLMRLGST